MKKVIALSMVAAFSAASCTAPWSRAPEPSVPPSGNRENVSGTPESTGTISSGNAAPSANGTGSSNGTAFTGTSSTGAVPPKPVAPTGSASGTGAETPTSTGSSSTGTADEEEYRDAMSEIDRLFDGIAGESATKK